MRNFSLRGIRFSIRFKIIAFIALIVGVISAFIALYFPAYIEGKELEDLHSKAQNIGMMIAYSISPALVFEDRKEIESAIDVAHQNKDVVYLIVQDSSGRVLAFRDDQRTIVPPDTGMHAINLDRPDLYNLEIPVMDHGIRIGRLLLGFSMEKTRMEIAETRKTVALVSFIIFLLAMVAAGWVGRLITSPLSVVAETAARIAEGDLTRRVGVVTNDEVGVLAYSFNLMVDKLETSYRSLEDVNRGLEGRVAKRTAQLQDEIGERKRAEDQLRKLSRAVEQSSVSIIITDKNGFIEYVNPKFTSVTGYPFEDARGKKPSILKSGHTPASLYRNLWETIGAGKEWRGELQNRKKTGEFFWANVSISPIRDSDGTTTHFVGVQEDITERMKLEQQLLQAQKLESIGTLAGGIAHDFNNILGIISGYAYDLEASRNDQGSFQKKIQVITNAVDRGANIVRQILTFARKAEVRHDLVDVNALVAEVSTLLEGTLPKTIAIELKLEKPLPRISIDATQLHQAILNLCVNARDAMFEKGLLIIETAFVNRETVQARFSQAVEDSYVRIRVKDSGVGMSESVVRRIFEPFFTTKEVGRGTGLGLAVVYGIVQTHHGYIDVESKQGSGSTFVMYFPIPAERCTELTSGGTVTQKRLFGDETVLLVEDEEPLREILRITLAKHGYHVLLASDGREGLRVFVDHQNIIGIVVTDIGLPKLDGTAMIVEMKHLKPDVKVIACSGYLNPALRTTLQHQSIADFIEKPFSPLLVVERIREILDGEREHPI